MNNKRNDDLEKNIIDDDVSKAIDDIFGNDFIELNISNEDIESGKINEENTVMTKDSDSDESKESVSISNDYSSLLDDTDTQSSKEDTSKIVNTDKKLDFKTAILFLLLCILAAIIIAFVLTKNEVAEENSVVCYKKIQTNDYDSTDEYVLNHSKDKLTYVTGTYVYYAKTENAISSINQVKENKLNVIINSNGIDGFTHTYEEGDNSVLINSYYDMSLIDFSKIKKDEIKKLSYLKLTSKMKVSDLEKMLQNEGYTCTKGK